MKKREASAPAENTVREDYDPDEWGNIELPGLSDEQLHSRIGTEAVSCWK